MLRTTLSPFLGDKLQSFQKINPSTAGFNVDLASEKWKAAPIDISPSGVASTAIFCRGLSRITGFERLRRDYKIPQMMPRIIFSILQLNI